MTTLSLFGLFAVTLMLAAYALEHRSPWFVLLFAGACALDAVEHGANILRPTEAPFLLAIGDAARRGGVVRYDA